MSEVKNVSGILDAIKSITANRESGRLEIDEAFFYRLKDGKIESGKPFSDRWAVAQALGYTVTPPQPGE